MKVAACQLDIAWENKEANFIKVAALLERSVLPAGSLVILPEMFATGFSFNPEITVEQPGGATETFLATHVTGSVNLIIPADSAIVMVVIPSTAEIGTQGGRIYANGRIVDYQFTGLDTDGDGLPDWWESRYFGNTTNASPTAIAPSGKNNLSCFQLGVSPFATNVFNLQISMQSGSGYPQLTWSTIGGKTYGASMASRLGSPNTWTTIYVVTETNAPVGMPGTQSYIDFFSVFNPASSNRFYRIQLH